MVGSVVPPNERTIKPIVTPLHRVETESGLILLVKDETVQKSGAFKYRGASAFVDAHADAHHFVTASTGNHAAGLVHAAVERDREITAFVPHSTPEAKLARLIRDQADVRYVVGGYEECERAALSFAATSGAMFVHSFDDETVVEGHRSLFAELRMQAPQLDRLYVPVGGGGLIAAALREFGEGVIGVEHEAATAMSDSLRTGTRVELPFASGPGGLCVRRVGALGFQAARARKIRVVIVDDDQVGRAMSRLWNAVGIRVEEAGAAAAAAALAEAADWHAGAVVACVASGGNIDDDQWRIALGRVRG